MFSISDYKMRVTPTHVYFWGGPPSQWFTSKFKGHLPIVSVVDGRRSLKKSTEIYEFSNAEKYMMMAKASMFGDESILAEMKSKSKAKELKDLGRQVKGFDQAAWDSANMVIVTIGNYYKITQSNSMWAFASEMGDREYVEGSPVDKVWGVGLSWDDPLIEDPKNWKGENRLGRCFGAAWDMAVAFGRDADPFQKFGKLIQIRGNI